MSKIVARTLSIILIAFLLVTLWPSLISRTTSLREFVRVPALSLQRKLPMYAFIFNNIFPTPTVSYVITSVEPEGGKVVPKGILFLEIVRRSDEGAMPSDDSYQFLSLHPLKNLGVGQKRAIKVVIPVDRFAPGAYWLKPTLRVYPNHPSDLLDGYQEAVEHEKKMPGFLDGWMKINVIGESGAEWKKERVAGAAEGSYNPQLIEFNNFWTVSGVSLVWLLSFCISSLVGWMKSRKKRENRGRF